MSVVSVALQNQLCMGDLRGGDVGTGDRDARQARGMGRINAVVERRAESYPPRMRHSQGAVPAGIVFFDIDGTLVTGTSSGSFLAKFLGHAAAVAEAEAQYAAGTLRNHEVCAIDARGWAGASEAELGRRLETLPLIDGIEQVVSWCRSQRLVPVLASLAWDPVGAHLARRFGFAAHCGPQLHSADGVYTGEVARSFDEHDKQDFALSTCRRYGVEPARCVAIGDGRSDLPLFGAVGFSVAFNASLDARAAGTVTVDSTSLVDTIPPIRTWLHPTEECGECGFDHSSDRERLATSCGSFPDVAGTLLRAADPDLVRRRAAPHVWSAVEYAAHVEEAIRWYAARIRRVLDEELPQLHAFDFDAAAETGRYREFSIDQLVAELRTACGDLADLTRSIDAAELSRAGLGSDGAPRTVAVLLARAEHELVHHELDLRRLLRIADAG